MAKKKILPLTLSFFLTVLPIMQYTEIVPCYADVKTDGQKYSILLSGCEGIGKSKNSSSINPDGKWQPDPPERVSYPSSGIDTSINYGYITDPDDLPDINFPDIIYGTVTDTPDQPENNNHETIVYPEQSGNEQGEQDCLGPAEAGSSQEADTIHGQINNVQEEGGDSSQADSRQDNETDPEQKGHVADAGTGPEAPSTENAPGQDLPDGQTSNPDSMKETCAILNSITKKITANANGILSAPSISIDTEGTGGFKVQTESDHWIKIGKKSLKQNSSNSISFSESGSFYIFVEPNKSLSKRTGTITVTHDTGIEQIQITVTQEALHAALEISTLQKTADRNGSFYNNAVNVTTNNTGSYSAKVNDECDWLGISSTDTTDMNLGLSEMSFYKDSIFYLVAKENTGSSRTAYVTVTHDYGNIEKTIIVTQLGNEDDCLKVDRTTSYFDSPEPASSTAFQVTAPDHFQWTASSSKNWIHVSSTSSGAAEKHASIECIGSGEFYIHVLKNSSYEERSGYVTVSAPGMESIQIYVSQEKNEHTPASLLQELYVHAEKKTFRRNSTTKIKIEYPEGLYPADVESITFSSNKTKVAKVTKSGKIRGIREGKAVISVFVTLDTGDSKLFRLKVTVGKRKIKVVKN